MTYSDKNREIFDKMLANDETDQGTCYKKKRQNDTSTLGLRSRKAVWCTQTEEEKREVDFGYRMDRADRITVHVKVGSEYCNEKHNRKK